MLVTCFVNAWCGSLYSCEFYGWMLFFFVQSGSIVWLCFVSVWGMCVVAFGMLGCMVVFV